MKIDVEGSELEVLKGAQETITRYQPAIYLEVDRVELTKSVLSYLLRIHEYHCFEHSIPFYNSENHKGGEPWDPNTNGGENILFIASRNALCVPRDTRVEALPKVLRGKDPLLV